MGGFGAGRDVEGKPGGGEGEGQNVVLREGGDGFGMVGNCGLG
jgi:hypothetical protein